MPGIVGIVGPQAAAPAAPELVADMLEAQRGRSRGSAEQLQLDTLPVRAAWTAASIAWNGRRDAALIWRGEVHAPNPAEAFRDYSGRPADFLARLNGIFSGLIFDLRAGQVILFNDRYGLSRVYLHENGEDLAFASEAKALLAIAPKTRHLDERGVAEQFSVGCVLQNRTLYRGIALLPPASCWCFHRDGRRERLRYFDPRCWEGLPPLTEAQYTERLIETYRSAAPRYLTSPAELALSMTAGLDSRMILAHLGPAERNVPCYTFSGPLRDCWDARIARRLSRVTGHPHVALRIGSALFTDFPRLADEAVACSDGAMDVTGAVELYANRRAREIAPIRLTGNYGSEILRRNLVLKHRHLDRGVFTAEFSRLLDEAAATYRTEAAAHPLTLIAFKQVPWLHYARRAVECSQLTPRSPFLDNDLVGLAYQAPSDAAAATRAIWRLIEAGDPRLGRIITDQGLRAHSIPLVTPARAAWLRFTTKLEYACDYGMPEVVARRQHLLPRSALRSFLGRHKFYHFRSWYQEVLADYVREMIATRAIPFPYREDAARLLASAHLARRGNHTSELHRLLSLQSIQTLLAQAASFRSTCLAR